MKSGSFDYIHYHSYALTDIIEKRLNTKFVVVSGNLIL
jgi:hypothetical protein